MKTAAEHHDELNIDMRGAFNILRHYGAEKQLLKLAEECRELEQAAIVAHHDLFFDGTLEESHMDNLVEEIADVCVVAYQIAYWLRAEDEVREIARQKIERTHERIAEEGKAKNDGN